MTIRAAGLLAGMLLLAVVTTGKEAAKSAAAANVESTYPGLVSGALTFASVKELPDGTLLEAGATRIGEDELQEQLKQIPDWLQEEARKNAVFFLEQLATRKLLSAAANATQDQTTATSAPAEDAIERYLEPIAAAVKATDAEIKEFYERNVSLCGGAPFEQVKDALTQYVLNQRREEAVRSHVRTLGQRMEIAVSARWLKTQAPLVRDNAIDQARAGGKPLLVGFGGAGCCGPDTMAPVLEAIGEQYGDKIALLAIEPKLEPILAARYGIESIPAQILYDKSGKEVFRHTGVMTEEEIAGKLATVGVE